MLATKLDMSTARPKWVDLSVKGVALKPTRPQCGSSTATGRSRRLSPCSAFALRVDSRGPTSTACLTPTAATVAPHPILRGVVCTRQRVCLVPTTSKARPCGTDVAKGGKARLRVRAGRVWHAAQTLCSPRSRRSLRLATTRMLTSRSFCSRVGPMGISGAWPLHATSLRGFVNDSIITHDTVTVDSSNRAILRC